MNTYTEKLTTKAALFDALAERADRQADALYARARAIQGMIPDGQPILIGHHSEATHRRALARIDGFYTKVRALQEKAKHYRDRAANCRNPRGISSDNPEAPNAIQEKIAELERVQERMKLFNKILHTHGPNAFEHFEIAGFSPEQVREHTRPDFAGRTGFPQYALTNNGANIRRYKKRLEELDARTSTSTATETPAGVQVIDNAEANRVQVIFPAIPSEAIRKALKRDGFKWAPTAGAWQRHRGAYALARAQEIAATYQPAPSGINTAAVIDHGADMSRED